MGEFEKTDRYAELILPSVDESLAYAVGRNPDLLNADQKAVLACTSQALNEIAEFEELAASHTHSFGLTEVDAEHIKAIWVQSGAGTYDAPSKEDSYKNFAWSRNMDHDRLSYAARLSRNITSLLSGEEHRVVKGNFKETKNQIKDDVATYGPYIIYDGRKDENDTVRDVLTRDGIIIPEDKVFIIDAPIRRTIDAVKEFRLPSTLTMSKGDRLVVIAHAPQMMRILHIMGKYQPALPKGVQVQVFPLSSNVAGRKEYASMEVSGFLASTFLSGDAAQKPYPYLLK